MASINVEACLDHMICCADFVMYDFVMHDFSVYTGIINRVWFLPSHLPRAFIHAWEKKMEEDNIAVSLCILIMIASAVLRIRLNRWPPRGVWAWYWIRKCVRYCAHHSLIKELCSGNTTLFQPFLLLTLALTFYTFNFITSKFCYE